MTLIIGVRFKRNGKIYYFDPAGFEVQSSQNVIVETARGVEYGRVVLGPKEVPDDKIVSPLKPIIRIATAEDDAQLADNKLKEKEAFNVCFEKIKKHELNMKLVDCEYTFDKCKLLFYFTADGRIDFRELVKDLAAVFRTRIELRQIGVRDETKLIGTYAICGRPLCCSTFLSEFAPVSIKMAKEQNLSLNPSKISGVCGRLMCCLKNEEPAYEYLNSILPNIGTKVTTFDGFKGEVQSVSILKQLVKVIVETGNDEKEIHEYTVDQIDFDTKKKPKGAPIAPALPDEETIDEKTLRELEKMEKEDYKELVEEAPEDDLVPAGTPTQNKPRHRQNFQQNKNHDFNKNNSSQNKDKRNNNYQPKRNNHNENNDASAPQKKNDFSHAPHNNKQNSKPASDSSKNDSGKFKTNKPNNPNNKGKKNYVYSENHAHRSSRVGKDLKKQMDYMNNEDLNE